MLDMVVLHKDQALDRHKSSPTCMCPTAPLNTASCVDHCHFACVSVTTRELRAISGHQCCVQATKRQWTAPHCAPWSQATSARCPRSSQGALACEGLHHVVTEAGTRGSGSQAGGSTVTYAGGCTCADTASGLIGSRRMHPLTLPCSVGNRTNDHLPSSIGRIPSWHASFSMRPSVWIRKAHFSKMLPYSCKCRPCQRQQLEHCGHKRAVLHSAAVRPRS
jgi:hypothetical protein